MKITSVLVSRFVLAALMIGGLIYFAPRLILKSLESGGFSEEAIIGQLDYSAYAAGLSLGCWLLLSIAFSSQELDFGTEETPERKTTAPRPPLFLRLIGRALLTTWEMSIKFLVVAFSAGGIYLKTFLAIFHNSPFMDHLPTDERRAVVMMTATAVAVVGSYVFANLFNFFSDVEWDGKEEDDDGQPEAIQMPNQGEVLA